MAERTLAGVTAIRSTEGRPYVQVRFEGEDGGGEHYTPEEATEYGLALIQAAAEAKTMVAMVERLGLEERIREMAGS